MFKSVTDKEWERLYAISDKAFHKALKRPEFSQGGKGHHEINVYWLFCWAWSDDSDNPRYSIIAPAIREIWPDHVKFDKVSFMPVARRMRYLKKTTT